MQMALDLLAVVGISTGLAGLTTLVGWLMVRHSERKVSARQGALTPDPLGPD